MSCVCARKVWLCNALIVMIWLPIFSIKISWRSCKFDLFSPSNYLITRGIAVTQRKIHGAWARSNLIYRLIPCHSNNFDCLFSINFGKWAAKLTTSLINFARKWMLLKRVIRFMFKTIVKMYFCVIWFNKIIIQFNEAVFKFVDVSVRRVIQFYFGTVNSGICAI